MTDPGYAENLRPALLQGLVALTGKDDFGPGRGIARVATTDDLPELAAILANTPERLVVLVDPGFPWRRGRRWRCGTHEIVREVQELVQRHERLPGPAYLLWPSATEPAYIIEFDGRSAFTWLRRSGVMAGGRAAWTRYLVSRPAIDGVLWWACPAGLVLVAAQ